MPLVRWSWGPVSTLMERWYVRYIGTVCTDVVQFAKGLVCTSIYMYVISAHGDMIWGNVTFVEYYEHGLPAAQRHS